MLLNLYIINNHEHIFGMHQYLSLKMYQVGMQNILTNLLAHIVNSQHHNQYML